MRYNCLLIFFCAFFALLTACAKSDQPEYSLRVMTYNVHNCKGTDNIFDYQRIADVIISSKSDMVSIQKLDSVTTRNNGVYSLGRLSELTGLYAVYCASTDYKEGKYGIGILSKERPISYYKITIPGSKEQRSLLVVEFKNLYFCCTHWPLVESERLACVTVMREELENKKKLVIVGGDYNAVPYSTEIMAMKKSFVCLNDENMHTFPSENPQKTIDFLFGYKGNSCKFIPSNTTVIDEKVASEHCPVYVDVSIFK